MARSLLPQHDPRKRVRKSIGDVPYTRSERPSHFTFAAHYAIVIVIVDVHVETDRSARKRRCAQCTPRNLDFHRISHAVRGRYHFDSVRHEVPQLQGDDSAPPDDVGGDSGRDAHQEADRIEVPLELLELDAALAEGRFKVAASLIAGAYHTAGQSGSLNDRPYPPAELRDAIEISVVVRDLDRFLQTPDAAAYEQIIPADLWPLPTYAEMLLGG